MCNIVIVKRLVKQRNSNTRKEKGTRLKSKIRRSRNEINRAILSYIHSRVPFSYNSLIAVHRVIVVMVMMVVMVMVDG